MGVAPAARWSAAWRVLGRVVGDLREACLSSRPDTPRAWPKAAGPDRVGVRASGTAAAVLGLRGPWEGRGHLDRGWRGALGGHLGGIRGASGGHLEGSPPCRPSAAGAAQAELLGRASSGPGVRTAGYWAHTHGSTQLRNPEAFDASRASTSPWRDARVSPRLLLPDSSRLSQAAQPGAPRQPGIWATLASVPQSPLVLSGWCETHFRGTGQGIAPRFASSSISSSN